MTNADTPSGDAADATRREGLLVQCPKAAPMDNLKGTGKSLRARHLMAIVPLIWCWGGGRWDSVAQNRAATSSPTPRAVCRNLLALSVQVHA